MNAKIKTQDLNLGQLIISKTVSTQYGFTSKGRGTVKARVAYSVYFVNASNADLQDFGVYSDKASAVKAFNAAKKSIEAKLKPDDVYRVTSTGVILKLVK